MNEFGIKRKIYGIKNIGGAKVQPRNDIYGYLPFTPDEFFIIFIYVSCTISGQTKIS